MPSVKLCAPRSHTLQQLRSDMLISYPIEHALCKTEVSRWLAWLSLEPPLFDHDKLISNPWCNGHLPSYSRKIYSVLVADTKSLVLQSPIHPLMSTAYRTTALTSLQSTVGVLLHMDSSDDFTERPNARALSGHSSALLCKDSPP